MTVDKNKTLAQSNSKNTFLFLGVIITLILCLNLASATWTERAVYTEDDMKVELKSWWGFFEWVGLDQTIGTMELKSHKSVDEVVSYGIGKQVTMYYDFDFKEIYENGLGEVKFIDMKTNKEVKRDYKFVYEFTEERSRENCIEYEVIDNSTIIGDEKGGDLKDPIVKPTEPKCLKYETEFYNYSEWRDYHYKLIPSEKIRIGIEVDSKNGDWIDGVWTIGTKSIDKHAQWSASLETNLVSWYRFNETSGTTAIDSHGSNNGTIGGATINQTGKVERAYLFDGVNDDITLGTDSSLNPTELTISAWLNSRVVASEEKFAVGRWGTGKYAFGVTNTGYFQGIVTTGSGTERRAISNTSYSANTWYHVTFTWSATDGGKLYMNGELVGTNANNANAQQGSSTVYIGSLQGSVLFWNGTIDELGIWSRPLSQSEIRTLYNEDDGCTYQDCGDTSNILINLTEPTNNTITNSNSLTFKANVTSTEDISVQNVSLFINGEIVSTNTDGTDKIYEFTRPNLEEGEYNWTIIAYSNESDRYNATETRTFEIDTTDPSITAELNQTTIDWGNDIKVYYNITDINLDKCWYYYNSVVQEITCGTSQNVDITIIEGQHLIQIYANDTAGNEDFVDLFFNSGLVILRNSPADNLETNIKDINFNVTITEASSEMPVNVSNVTLYVYQSGTEVFSDTDYTGTIGTYIWNEDLEDGNYTWQIIAYDEDDKAYETTNRTFEIDTTPFIEYLSPTPDNNTFWNQSIIPVKVNVSTAYFKNITYDLYNPDGIYQQLYFDNETYEINFTNCLCNNYQYNVTICTTTNQCNTTETRFLEVDLILPTIEVSTDSAIIYDLEAPQLIEYKITDVNLDTCWINYNSINTTIDCTSGVDEAYNLTLVSGQTNVTIYANDTAQNFNSESFTLTIDPYAPNITFNYPTTVDYAKVGDELEISFTAEDVNLDSVWYIYGTNLSYTLFDEDNSTGVIEPGKYILYKTNHEENLTLVFYDAIGESFVTFSSNTSICGTNPIFVERIPPFELQGGRIEVTCGENILLYIPTSNAIWTISRALREIYGAEEVIFEEIVGATSGVDNLENITLLNSKEVTIYANDTAGNIESEVFNWDYRLFETGEFFNSPTLSGAVNPFNKTLTANNQITVAYLNYNGVNSLASISSIGDSYTLSTTRTAPGVSSEENVSFYWNITQANGFNYATEEQNQTITPLTINQTCGAGMYTIYNLTLADELTKATLSGAGNNTEILVDLDIYTHTRSSFLGKFSHRYSQVNPASICIDNNLSGGESYSMDLQIQYKATNYSTELYHIYNFMLNASSLNQNITLYDLESEKAQDFRLVVKDSSFLPIEGALIQIERKYIDEGVFYITEIPKTDARGITSASLQVNDAIYNFHIYSNGNLVKSFTNVLAICQTPLVKECEIDFKDFQTGINIPDYGSGDDFVFTLGYNSTSRTVSSVFNIPSGEPSEIKLEIIREDTLGTEICTDTLTSASGTLTCVIPSAFGNSTVSARLYKNDIEQGRGGIKLDQSSRDVFGVILVMLSVLVMMTLIGLAISDNPIISGVFLFVGVLLLFGMNLVESTGFVGATATILFLAIAIILVLIKAGRRN